MDTATPDLLTPEYRVEPQAFWAACQVRGDDGYGRMEVAHAWRWHPVPGWGRDGWDLGDWPYVVIYHRRVADGYELAENVEGDVTCYRYSTRELRDAATDQLAFWHWKHNAEDRVEGIDSIADAPHLSGPYGSSRDGS